MHGRRRRQEAAPLHGRNQPLLTRLRSKAVLTLTAAAALALVPAAVANAALIDTSLCDGATLSQPFSPWGDANLYKPAPGGDAEGSLTGWTLSGGAKRAAVNSPFSNGDSSFSIP